MRCETRVRQLCSRRRRCLSCPTASAQSPKADAITRRFIFLSARRIMSRPCFSCPTTAAH